MRLSTIGLPRPRSGRRRLAVSLASWLAAAGLLVGGTPVGTAVAQPSAALPGPPSPAGMGEQVGAALYNRGMALFELGDIASAKALFSESLERSPDGSRAADALGMLRKCNEKLGIQDLDAGRPLLGPSSDGPLDPYATTSGDENAPLDPYATTEGPLDPYAVDGNLGGDGHTGDPGQLPLGPDADTAGGNARTDLMISGGLWGFITGMALTGPFEEVNGETGNFSGAAVPLGVLVGAGGVYLGYYLSDRYDGGGARAVSSGSVWGMYNFAHLANVFTGDTTNGNDIYQSMALGGLAGGGLGHWYARKYSPTEGNVAVTNSFSFMGTGAGLMLGLAMDPPRGDAYSLNATLGSIAGIGAGIYLRDDVVATPKRMTMVNLGALGGALVPWVLVYPLVDSTDGGDHQIAGFLSALTMGGGAYLAWRLTADDDDDEAGGGQFPLTSAPALLQRSESGQWGLGTPMPRPMHNHSLAPQNGVSMGADLLSGRF